MTSVRENLIAAKALFETSGRSPLQAICDCTVLMKDFRDTRNGLLAGSNVVDPTSPTALGALRDMPRDVVISEFDRAIAALPLHEGSGE